MLTVYIADEHQLVREGLKTMLAKGETPIMGEASDGPGLLELVRRKPPDAVLLALKLPGLNGIEVARVLQAEYPQVAVVLLSNFYEDHWIEAVMESGIRGYLLKNAEKNEIKVALQVVFFGGEYYSPRIREKMERIRRKRASAEQLAREFTPRELEVIQLVCAGYSNNMIAEALQVSPNTVKVFKTKIFQKAGVRNSIALVAYVMGRGLV